MQDLKGKRLLVLGGAFQHCKLVEAAHELGVYVIVDDYLSVERAPAKQMADKYYMHNITEIDQIVEMCRIEGVDGVLATSLDACQKPYQMVCERLQFPCFGTAEQYNIMTDKRLFKDYCRRSGVDVITEYEENAFDTSEECKARVEFPVLIKPRESRGSRGQSVCNNYEDALEGIRLAKSESMTEGVVIEKYMGQKNDFAVTFLVLNGKVIPFRTVDRILGDKEDGLDKLAVGAVMPSVFTNVYLEKVHQKVERFVKNIGIKNAPMFFQGFVDGDAIRFYDPGLRLPGGEYERMFRYVTNKNIFYPLIEYALTGQVSEDSLMLSAEDVWLRGKIAVQVLPTLKEGTIACIDGLDRIRRHPKVVSVFEKYSEGDVVSETHNVNQRFCEIDLVCDDKNEAVQLIEWIYNSLKISDVNGEDMIVSRFDPNVI